MKLKANKLMDKIAARAYMSFQFREFHPINGTQFLVPRIIEVIEEGSREFVDPYLV